MEDLEDDWWLGNEPDDTHPLAATAKERIDLVDATDHPCPRFPAGRKPGAAGSRRIGQFVLRRDSDENLAPSRDSAMSIRMLPDEFRTQGGAFGGAGRAEPSLFAGEGDEVFIPTGVASDARETSLGKAAPEKAFDGLRYDPPQRAEGPLEPLFIFPGEPVEELVKNGVEGGPLGASGAVEFRYVDRGNRWFHIRRSVKERTNLYSGKRKSGEVPLSLCRMAPSSNRFLSPAP
jgi:hypothetical protein